MKFKVLFLIGLSLFVQISAKNKKPKEIKPKNMKFIPKGCHVDNKKDSINKLIVRSFWISDEVTNKEYKEFFDYVNSHSNKGLSQSNVGNPKSKKMKNQAEFSRYKKKYLNNINYTEISKLLIDLNKQPFKGYFTNKKYANYPVVGVSHKAATHYCAWKTEMEVKKHVEQGKPLYFAYRLPTEKEWIYVASQIKNTSRSKNTKEIMPSKKGKVSGFGVKHLLDNVSEWTSTNSNCGDPQLKLVKGSSVNIEQGVYENIKFNENASESYIGFRIVRPYFID